MNKKSLFKNFIANSIGQLVYPILSILLVPFYIQRLGLEGYGLVGFFSLLLTLLGVFSDGLGAAIQREFARRDGKPNLRASMTQLLQTFEMLYWALGLIVGFGLVAFSSIADMRLVNTQTIPNSTVRICLLVISVTIALRFPLSIYQATLFGLQEQVLANKLNVIFSLFQAIFSAAVVWMWGSVIVFFMSSMLVTVIQVFVIRFWAHKALPIINSQSVPRFVWSEVKQLWKISFDLIWTNGIGLLITQMDRLMIARIMPVSSLGVYTTGTSGGRLLSMVSSPFLTASYPDICQQALSSDHSLFDRAVMRNAKIIMAIGMAVGLPVSLFTADILMVWTQNDIVVEEGALAMSVYIIGNLLISYATVLYHALMALGQTRYGLWLNVSALLWFPILVWVLVSKFGLIGAALGWLIYSIIGWLFNMIVFLIVRSYQIIGPYISMVIQTSIVGISISLITKYYANRFFPDLIWGRILMAVSSSLLIGIICLFIGFGFRKEIIQLLREEIGI